MSSLADHEPRVWAPAYWKMIAHLVNAYPHTNPSGELERATQSFFESLVELIPCQECRTHYAEWINQHPISDATSTRNLLANWVANMKHTMSGTQQKSFEDLQKHEPRPTRAKTLREIRLEAQLRLADPPARPILGNLRSKKNQRIARPLKRNRVTTRSGKQGCNCNNNISK